MTKYSCIFFWLLISCSPSHVQEDKKNDWVQIWGDEFDKDGPPDPDKWRFAGRGRSDWNCYCTDDPSVAYVKDGNLYLKGMLNKGGTDTVKYHTSCIQTKDKFSFKYGKIEVRAKLSKGKGSWPAIWLMPQESNYGGWPESGEIDIMEHLNYDSIVYQTIHSHYVDKMNKRKDPPYYAVSSWNEGDYTIFGLEWYPGRLDFFVDRQKTFSYPRLDDADARQWPFDQEFYIILDQALGGDWVGTIDDKDLPVQMVVDWVRVYQLDTPEKKGEQVSYHPPDI